MDDLEYFDVDGPVSDEEREFLSALRDRIDGRIWPYCSREDLAETGTMLVVIDIDDPGRVALLTVAVRVHGGRLHGDRLQDQYHVFPDKPTSIAIDAEGLPDELAAVAAAWFETQLGRTIVRREWLHEDQVYAFAYVLADTGEPLVQMYREDLAPPGSTDQLIRNGHVYGKGWIQTSGLRSPDRATTVRP